MGSNPAPEPPARGASEDESVWRVALRDEAATERLAAQVAGMVGAGSLITLSGDLGSGKTTFARALIRAIVADPDLSVPSPTFTLMQTYDGPRFPIVHADLYRIESPSELAELGWDEAGDEALVIVEWPDHAGAALPADRLDIELRIEPGQELGSRQARLRGRGPLAPAIASARAIAALLAGAGWGEARRAFMMGDASTRAYERLSKPDGTTAILMIAPPRPPGPVVRAGKPYPTIARLSPNIDAFIAVDRGLRALGFSAPAIEAVDRTVGLAILEDLGSEPVAGADGPMPERYGEAVALLAQLHALDLPRTLPVDADTYAIPRYDLDALLIEVELLLEWYAPHIAGHTLPASTKSIFVNGWRSALGELMASASPTWTLRDFHSPNLIWLAEREGLARLGLIDFQDCVLGPPAYDVAALLQDARVTVPDALELNLLGRYAQLRRRADAGFDTAAFARTYAIAGAQRATKILGLFTRLDRRDGKPQYLAHLPRIQHYLVKDLGHPALSQLRAWYETYLPKLFTPAP